jgi:hypothetical protein
MHIAPTIRRLAQHQYPSGQFPTIVVNAKEGIRREVGTLTPTYLVCLMLSLYRQSYGSSAELDRIIERCLDYIESRCYFEPIEGYRVWHFSAFYPPDWEETCWCAWLLYEAGRLRREDLEALYRLLCKNETPDNGIGVWVKHDYCQGEKYSNVYDGFVDLAIIFWLESIFGVRSNPTSKYLAQSFTAGNLSQYYYPEFASFFFSLFGFGDRPAKLPSGNTPLFRQSHHQVVDYVSPSVWTAASLFV